MKTLDIGGAETNLLNILRNVDRESIEPHLAYCSGGVLESTFKKLDVPLFKYSDNSPRVQSLETFPIVLKLAGYIKKNKLNIIHTHVFNAHVWGALAAKLAGAKVVEHVHDYRYEEADYLRENGIGRPEQFKQASFFARLSDRIVVLTKNNKNFVMRKASATDSKVMIVPNAMPLDLPVKIDKTELLTRLNLPTEKKIIFWAVRLSPEKNPGFIFEIAERLRDREDILFVIAGDGPLLDPLRREVSQRRLERKIRFIGFYNEPLDWLRACDIAIQPTFLELHSIMMMEAMSVSKPILVSKGVGCNDDFITHGINGFLLDPRKSVEWSDTIRYLLDHPIEAERIAAAGRNLIETKYNVTRHNTDFEEVYNGVLT